MSENKRDPEEKPDPDGKREQDDESEQEERTILGGLGNIVDEVNKTAQDTIERGAAGTGAITGAIGGGLKRTIKGMRPSRENVVMVRVDDYSKYKLDQLLEAGIAGSRSEAAAFLILEGIRARGQLFDTISEKVEDIRRTKEELQRLLEREDESTGYPE